MYKLEDRILFDAAAVADVADAQQEADAQAEAAAQAAEAEEAAAQEAAESADGGDFDNTEADDPGSLEAVLAAVEAGNLGSDGQRVDVLLVSNSLENAEDIINATSSDTIVVRYDARTTSAADLLQQITDALDGNLADSIGFATESGENAEVQLFADTDTSLDTVNDSTHQDFFNTLGSLMDEGSQVNLFASNLASTVEGTALVDAIGDVLGHDVAASINETGAESAGGDWNLEYSTNAVETDIAETYLDENLIDNFDSLLDDTASHEVAFINSSVMNVEEILDDLGDNVEIVMLETGTDGLDYITDYLNEHSDIKYDAVHIISHGNEGYFVLNGQVVDGDYVSENSSDFVQWRNALSDDADIMIYGCNLTGSLSGKDLVANIASLTGADVAASTDTVGGNDWSLEYAIGDINYGAFDIDNYDNRLADWDVTNADDSGTNSLRWAINQAVTGDSVTFNSDYTITLTSAVLSIDGKSIYIVGGSNNITVNSADYGIFNITGTGGLAVSDITISTTAVGANAITNAGALSTDTVTAGSISNTNGTFTVTGDTDITSLTGGTATINSGQELTASGDVSTTDLAVNGTLTLSGSGTPLAVSGTFSSTGTVDYANTGAQTITDLAYNNLTVSGSGTKSASAINAVALNINDSVTLDVGGDVTVSGTTTFASNGSLELTGDYSTGSFTKGTGTVTYDGTTQTVASVAYHNLVFSGSGTKSASGSVSTSGNLTINDTAVFDIDGNLNVVGITEFTGTADGGLTLGGSYSTSSLIAGSGTVTYDGTGAPQAIYVVNYNNLILSGASSTKTATNIYVGNDLTINDDVILDVTGYVTVISATTFADDGNLKLTGDYSTGTFTSGTGTVTYDGTGSQTVVGGITYYNLIVSGTGSTKTASGDIAATSLTINNDVILGVDGDLAVSGATTFTATGTLSLTGDYSTGTFTAGTGTVSYTGTGAQVVAADITYNNLIVSTSGTKTASGTLAAASLTVNDTATLSVDGAVTAASLTINNTATLNVNGNLTLTGDLTFGDSGTLGIAGDLSVTNSIFTAASGTVQFIDVTGDAHTITLAGTTTSLDFYNLTLDADQAVTLAASAAISISNLYTANTGAYVDLATNSTVMTMGESALAMAGAGGVVTGTGGELRKAVAAGGPADSSYTFRVGSLDSGYVSSQALISLTGATSGASAYISVKVVDTAPPDIDGETNYIDRYWIVDSNDITGYTADLTFSYIGDDVVKGGTDTFYNHVGVAGTPITWTEISATFPQPIVGTDGTFTLSNQSGLGYFASFGDDPSSIVVTNTNDDLAAGSLRWAVNQANITVGSDIITFDPTVFAAGDATITLTLGELLVTERLTIDAEMQLTGALTTITISADDASRIFNVAASTTLTLEDGLVITDGGGVTQGGAIYNAGELILTNVDVTDSNATSQGGAIYNASGAFLTLDTNDDAGLTGDFATTISGNSAGVEATDSVLGVQGFGGAIYNEGTVNANTTWDLTFGGDDDVESTTTISDNTAYYETTVVGADAAPTADGQGGGVFNSTGDMLAISNSVISGNTAGQGGGVYNDGTLTLTTTNRTSDYALSYAAISDNLTPEATAGNVYEAVAGVYNDTGATITLASDWLAADRTNLPEEYTTPMSRIEGNVSSVAGGTGGVYNAGTITFDTSVASNAGSIYNNTGGAGVALINGGVGGVYNAATGTFTVTSTANSGLIDGNTGGAGVDGGEFVVLATDGGAGGVLTLNDIDLSFDTASSSHLIISNNTGGAGGKGKDDYDGADGGAGGVSFGDNDLTISYFTVSSNTGGAAGAAGTAAEGSTTVDGISGGGGIDNTRTGTILTFMTIDSNSGADGGGVQNTSEITITNSVISNNIGTSAGGIYARGTDTTITNSTIAFNTATSGGGIYYYYNGDLTMNFVTVGRNTGAGGIYLVGASSSDVTIENSLLSNNGTNENDIFFYTPEGADDPFGSVSLDYSVYGTNWDNGISGSNNVHLTSDADYANVRLDSALRSSYGATKVLAVQQDSTAIAAGSTTLPIPTITTDQRGMMRHNTPSGSIYPTLSAPTAGAYEYVEALTYVVTRSDDPTGTGSIGDLSLRQAVAMANAHVGEDGHDKIIFDGSVFDTATTITLTTAQGGELTITDGLIIEGLGERSGSDLITVNGGDASRIFNIDSTGSTWNDDVSINVIVSGLTITDGLEVSANGGAIMVAADMSLDLSKVTVNSSSALNGGGIYNAGTLSMSRSTVTGNSVTVTVSGDGGGDVVSATAAGGGIYSTGILTLNDSTVSANTVTVSVTNTGTLAADNATANALGAGVYINGSSAVFNSYDSTISTNTVAATASVGGSGTATENANGGGIYIADSLANSVNFYNSTIDGNTAGNAAGGIYSNENITVSSSTIAYNTDSGVIGAGITMNTGTATVYSSIVAFNNTPTPISQDISGTFSQTSSLVGGTSTYSYIVHPTDDLFVTSSSMDNGGWTNTMALLSTASDAINHGAGTAFDQRGYEANGTRDIGAYEYNGYVAVNESTGTRYSTIQAAENGAAAGDIISLVGTRILEGSIAIDAGIILAGHGEDVTVISGGGSDQVLNIANANADITVKLEDLTITEGSETFGGAIYNAENLVLEHVTVENSTSVVGGAIYNTGNLNVHYSTITNNTAGWDGGGIYNASIATVLIQDSNIVYNSAMDGGGIYSAGTLYMKNSAVAYNTASTDGGGLYLSGNQNIINNSTIAHNNADNDGGGLIYNATNPNDSNLSLTSVTLAFNHADNDNSGAGNGGGVYFAGGTMTVNNTILATNYNGGSSSTTPDNFYSEDTAQTTLLNLGYNLIGTSTPTWTNALGDITYTYSDPQTIFSTGVIADNGGWSWSLALAAGGQAVNNGSDSGSLTYDQRGYLYNATDYATGSNSTRDIGAYEYNGYVGTLEYVNLAGKNQTVYYTTVQDAVDAAVQYPDKAVIVYTLNLANTRIKESEIFISNDVTIKGSSYGGTVISAADAGRIFYSSSAVTASIDKVDMTDGKVYQTTNFSAPWSRSGGALYVDAFTDVSSGLTLTNSAITNSGAEGDGGGVYIAAGAQLTASNVLVGNNKAMNLGGGIYNAGTASFTSSTIAWNTADANAGAAFNSGTLTLVDVTASQNLTINGTDGGVADIAAGSIRTIGGIWNYNGTLGSTNSIIGYNYQGAYSSTYDFGRITSVDDEGEPTTTPVIADGGYNIIGTQNGSWTSEKPNNFFNMATNPTAPGYNHNISDNGRSFTSGRLGDFGGWTKTMALYDTGIAVDSGTGSHADQRGYGVQATRDRGAFEYAGSVVISGSYSSINLAIAAASSGDTITLVDSRILETDIHINKDIILTGSSATLLSGDNQGRVIYVAAGVSSSINTVIISEGYAGRGLNSVSPAEGTGAGIYNAGTLTLTDVSVVNNYAQISGGGVYNAGSLDVKMSSGSVTDIFFDNNLALQTGAAIFSSSSATSLTVTGNIYKAKPYEQGLIQFTNNIAASGAGIYSDGTATISISKVEMTHNRATENGGALVIINNTGQTAAISESGFNYNLAEANGGVFYANNSGDMTMDFVNIQYNVAGISGGVGYWDSSGSITITTESAGRADFYSGINYNYAMTGDGGALYLISSENLTIEGVSGDTESGTTVNYSRTYAGHGGAVYMNSSGDFTTQYYSRFTYNYTNNTSYDGGTVYFVNSGNIAAHFSTFRGYGSTTQNFSDKGGIFYVENSGNFLLDKSSVLRYGVAQTAGGQVYMSNSGNFTINYGQLYFGDVNSGSGGALYMVNSGDISLTDADVYDNDASGAGNNGGAFYYDGLNASTSSGLGTFTINTSGINSNDSWDGAGGAIYQETGTLDITNSTLAYNWSDDGAGGAIYMGDNSTLKMTFATVAYNLASTTGDDIYMTDSSGSSFSSINSIYFNTQASSVTTIDLGASVSVSSSTYNVYSHYTGTRLAGAGNITNYTTIQNQLYLDTNLRYHANYRSLGLALMYEQSIALSAGTGVGGISTDQRGNNRIGTDANGNSYGSPSIGAFEPLYYITVTSNDDTAKLHNVIYDERPAPNQFFSDAQEDGITLREAAYWLDTYDFVTAQNIANSGKALYESLQVFDDNTAPAEVYEDGNLLTKVNYADLTSGANEWAWYNNQVVLAISPGTNIITYKTASSETTTTAFTDQWVSDLHDTNRYVKFDTSSMESTNITLKYDDIYIGDNRPDFLASDHKEIQFSVTPGGYEAFDLNTGVSTMRYFVGSGYNENIYLAQNDAGRITVSGNDISRIFRIEDGSTTINNLTLTNGHAPATGISSTNPDNGGAIYNESIVVLNNALIKDSNAFDDSDVAGGFGGGIYSSSNATSLTLNDSTIINNTATAFDDNNKTNSGQGGGIYIDGGDLVINRSLITGNKTVGAANGDSINKNYAQGGGVYFNGDDMFVYNSTISANNNDASMVGAYTFGDGTKTASAGRGSAFYITSDADRVYFYNNTIVNNTVDAPVAGDTENTPTSAIYYADTGGTLRLANNLIANNNSKDLYTASAENYGDYNIIGSYDGSYTPGASDITGDIYGVVANLHLSDTLLYNGGKTMNYRLLEGSVAYASGIDGTGGTITGFEITTDQRGAVRPDPAGGLYDIGSYQALTAITVTNDGDSDDGTYSDVTFDFTAGQNAAGWASNDVTFRTALNLIDSTYNVGIQTNPNRVNEPTNIETGTITIDSTSANWDEEKNTVTLNAALRVFLGVTIDGSIATDDVIFDAGETNEFRVMTINDSYNANRVNVAINDAIFKNGAVTGSGSDGYGGGIYNLENLTLTRVQITENAAVGLGGGIYSLSGDLSILGSSSVDSNTAGSHGGGIYYENSTLTLTDIIISENTSTTGHGGGIYAASATLDFNAAVISKNTATAGHGGGLFALSSNVTIDANATGTIISQISGNIAGLNGGGIYKQGGTLDISNTLVGGIVSPVKPATGETRALGNTASGAGGGIYNVSGAMTLTEGTVAYNVSGTDGGGIYSNSALTIVNSTLAFNTADNDGGAIYFTSAGNTLSITYTTIAYNHADNADSKSGDGYGGGVYANQGSIYMINSIVASNYKGSTITSADDLYINASLISNANVNITYSGIGAYNSEVAGYTFVNNAPALGNLLGPAIIKLGLGTELEEFSNSAPMLYLQATSTLANAGTVIAVTTSQNDVARANGSISEGNPDMGAYENNPTASTYFFDSTGDGDVTNRLNWKDTGGTAAASFNITDGLFIFDDDTAVLNATVGIVGAGIWTIGSRTTVEIQSGASFTINTTGSIAVTSVATGEIQTNFTVTNTGSINIGVADAAFYTPVNLTVSTTSSTEYSLDGDQTVYTTTYGDLIIFGTGTKTAAGTITVAGDLAVTAGSTYTSTLATNVIGTATLTNATLNVVDMTAGTLNATSSTITSTSNVTATAINMNSSSLTASGTVTGTTSITLDTANITASTIATGTMIANNGTSTVTADNYNIINFDVNNSGSKLSIQNTSDITIMNTGSPTFNSNNMTVDSGAIIEFETTSNAGVNISNGASGIVGTLSIIANEINPLEVTLSTGSLSVTSRVEAINLVNLTINGSITFGGKVILDKNGTGSGTIMVTSNTGAVSFSGTVDGNGKSLLTNSATFTELNDISDLLNLTVNATIETRLTGKISGSGTIDFVGTTGSGVVKVYGDSTVSGTSINAGVVSGTGTEDLSLTATSTSTITSISSLDNLTFNGSGVTYTMSDSITNVSGTLTNNSILGVDGNNVEAALLINNGTLTAATVIVTDLNNTGILTNASTVTVDSSLNNSGTFSTTTLEAKGDVTNTSTGTMAITNLSLLDSSTLSLGGNVGNFTTLTVANGTVANPKDVSLTSGNITVANFTFLGATSTSKFALASGTSLDATNINDSVAANYYDGAYFDTSGGGQLVRTMTGSAVEYRVGNATSATVINLTVANTTEKVAAHVLDSVKFNGGIVTGIQDTAGFTTYLERNWDGTSGTGNIDVTTNWSTALEGSSFDPADSTKLFVLDGAWSNEEDITVTFNPVVSGRRSALYTLQHNGTYAFANAGANMTIPITDLNGNIALWEMSNPNYSSILGDVDNLTNFPIGQYPYFSTRGIFGDPASVGRSVYRHMEYRMAMNPLSNPLTGQVPAPGTLLGQAITEGADLNLTSDASVYLEVNGEYSVGRGWLPVGEPVSAANVEQYQAPITEGQLDEFYLEFGGRENIFDKPTSFRSDLDEILDDLLAG